MLKKGGRSIGRKVIMSSRWMNILPWVGVVIAVIGLTGLILGILTALISSLPLAGSALILTGLGVILCGVVLFFAMCIVQDITGMF
ncbi:MAG: hypothetical protein R6U89_01855 [Dehalococcoidia bacterium]